MKRFKTALCLILAVLLLTGGGGAVSYAGDAARPQISGNAEKMRLYDFLFQAHTYLMHYDMRDFTYEYDFVKGLWLDFLEEIPSEDVRTMLANEKWIIDIYFPLEEPFRLSYEEFLEAFFYFLEANPQFFLARIVPVVWECDIGLTPWLSIYAYWAFAERRQEAAR